MAIEVLMDSNEQTSKRAVDLKKAVEDHADCFTWKGFDEIPVDVRFRDTETFRTISVELKEPADLAASVANGHLARQIIMLHEAEEPGFVVCTGSLQDVFDSVFARSKQDRYRDFGLIKHFCSTSFGDGYPVFFFDMQWAQFTLSHIDDYFKKPSVCKFLHKDKEHLTEVAMLCMVPGIGATTAIEIMKKYGSIRALLSADVTELEAMKINGRKLGKKAKALGDVFR